MSYDLNELRRLEKEAAIPGYGDPQPGGGKRVPLHTDPAMRIIVLAKSWGVANASRDGARFGERRFFFNDQLVPPMGLYGGRRMRRIRIGMN